MEIENIVANTVYIKARESQFYFYWTEFVISYLLFQVEARKKAKVKSGKLTYNFLITSSVYISSVKLTSGRLISFVYPLIRKIFLVTLTLLKNNP